MTNDEGSIRARITAELARRGLDFDDGQFVVAKDTPQGMLVEQPQESQLDADDFALNKSKAGMTDVYVMSGNAQHGLRKVVQGELVFVFNPPT